MARNGSGVMSIINTFVNDTTATADSVNANFSDIASEITGSLPRNGEAGMTGQFKAASGTEAAPGIAFSSDTGMGVRRSGSAEMAVVVAGVDVALINATGLLMESGYVIKDQAGTTITGSQGIPAGTAMLFVQASAPTGWTKSVAYNNYALRVTSGTGGVLGGNTGFTSVFAVRTITRANLPNDVVTTGTESQSHTHAVTGVPAAGAEGTTGGGSISESTTTYTTGSASQTHTHQFNLNGGVTQTTMDFNVAYIDTIICTKD